MQLVTTDIVKGTVTVDGAVVFPAPAAPPVIPPPVVIPPTSSEAAFVAAITDAFAKGRPLVTSGSVVVTTPIKIVIPANLQTISGLLGNGLQIISQITNGLDVLTIEVDTPNVNLQYMILEKFQIIGNGKEGNGLVIRCATNSSWIYTSTFRDIVTINCGKAGQVYDGSVFESNLSGCYSMGNGGAGFVFSDNPAGGNCSAMHMQLCGSRKNGGNGVDMLNGCRDVHVKTTYFCENHGWGINATQGIEEVDSCGFENNGGGLTFQNYANLSRCTFSTGGTQKTQIDGYLSGASTMIGTDWEYYGPAPSTQFANLRGTGTMSVMGSFDKANSVIAPTVQLKTL